MLFNFHAIQRYVDWDGSVEELCDLLTHLGLEVEDVRTPDPLCQGLVVGEVLTRDPHPNADRLTFCTVRVDAGPPQEIVCGATNHFVGAKVVVALPGQALPGGLTIEKRKVRGLVSAGMMCSAREIRLGEDQEGILLLPEDAVVGSPAIPYLTTIELNVTPNRPDCLGWIGIAREIASATGQTVRFPESHIETFGEEKVPITSEDPEGCPRYLGRVIRGVKVGPSPQWLRDAVAQVGLSSINNVVDATNFVLLEWGHPLHAFDLSKLRGPEIRVRRAGAGEKMVAINHESYTLNPEILVIADSAGPVAVAGIMGGEGSEVSESTTDLFLECAYFHPPRIRIGSKSIGLSSDSSFRFERGMDAYGLQGALDRCTQIILEVAGGKVTSPQLEAVSYDQMPKRAKITLRSMKASQTVGATISDSIQASILRGLGCDVTEMEGGQMYVEAPGFRPDLVREIDLIEEIARHFGYRDIPSTPTELPDQAGQMHPAFKMEQRLRDFLIGRGWMEAKSFSFAHPDFAERLNLSAQDPLRHSVPIINPLSAEISHLRTTLLGSLLSILEWNVKRGERSMCFFELGKVYLRDFEDLLRCERPALGLALLGGPHSHWSSKTPEYDFFDAKGVCEALFSEAGIEGAELVPFECEYFYPGQSGRWVFGDTNLGVLGRVHPLVSKHYDLPGDPILVEMDITAFYGAIEPLSLQARGPSVFPPIRRDLSLNVPIEISAREVSERIAKSQTPFLESFELFDRYTGEQVGEGHQSLAFRLTYRSSEKTLTDAEIGPVHVGLLKELNDRLGATQRGMESERSHRE